MDSYEEEESNDYEEDLYNEEEAEENIEVDVDDTLYEYEEPIEASISALKESKHEDLEWLKIISEQLFDEDFIDEKYYEVLQQMGQFAIEMADEESIEKQQAPSLLDERFGLSEMHVDHKKIIEKFMQQLNNDTTAFSILTEKREKVMERYLQALNKEKERTMVKVTLLYSLSAILLILQFSRAHCQIKNLPNLSFEHQAKRTFLHQESQRQLLL